MALIGYARVSTQDQHLTGQLGAALGDCAKAHQLPANPMARITAAIKRMQARAMRRSKAPIGAGPISFRTRDVQNEHRAIYRATIKRDDALASALIAAHVRDTMETLIEAMRNGSLKWIAPPAARKQLNGL